MKYQIIVLLLLAFTLFGCFKDDSSKTYQLRYVVFYLGYNDTQVVSAHHKFAWSCDRGNNYIKHYDLTGPEVYSGSAPYKILDYTLTIDSNPK